MRAVLQRVASARVLVDGSPIASIGTGLLILLGVGQADSAELAGDLADKVAGLRIFEDEHGKTNLSIMDIGGSALVVSQFTLLADTRRGRRPSFTDAAAPEVAGPLVQAFAVRLADHGIPVQTGRFGAHMQIELVNDGPMTILLER